ncbi:MAG: 3-phosphoshikimate 1-carboxyvinyltransferase, partial [Alphaproteobacteria bacterium]
MAESTLPYISKQSSLRGTIRIPGDKSISHRALMLASQVQGNVRITGLLEAEDVLHTAAALQSLGVSITRESSQWTVHGHGAGSLTESSCVLDMGNSGTSTRLLIGLVSTYPFSTTFSGDTSLTQRPMARVIRPLQQMGATFSARSGDLLPLTVTGTAHPRAITYELPVASAQVKSAIMLAGLNTPGDTIIIEPRRSRDHTEHMLHHLGFRLKVEDFGDGKRITLPGKQHVRVRNAHIDVPSDPSSAAFPIVAALICPDSGITIPNVCVNPLRTGLITSLQEMGADITFSNQRSAGGEPIADVTARSSRLKGITVPPVRAPSMIDEYLILAVAASFAEGDTVLTGLAELRVKESDRLGAIVKGLTACGVQVRSEDDNLTITGCGRPKGGAVIETKGDHRVAMSFLVMGMASKEPVQVDDTSHVATSFPGFTELMNRCGAQMHPPGDISAAPLVVAVDGPAASGKGTLARRLAEHYGLE